MIAALICGRAENQPFPGRNTFPLLGRPMVVYPMLAALHSAEVRGTFLSTDDPGMASIGEHYGVETIDRPPELCTAGVPLEDVILHGYHAINRRTGRELEALVVLLANAPTVTSGLIDHGVEMLQADPILDAVITVSRHNEFHPRNALQLTSDGCLRTYLGRTAESPADAYFPDALLWVLRPGAFFKATRPAVRPNWVVNTDLQRVRPLVHEGYGDVDYDWQIPIVEEWLRRRGFSEEATPYSPKTAGPVPLGPFTRIAPTSTIERRVLITTVPFGQANRRPLDLLEATAADYVINPIGRRLKEDELAEMVGDFGILIAGTEPITAKVMQAAPHLRLISRVGIGLDNVDLLAARERGIHITYTPDAPSPAVAELAIGLMLGLLRHIPGTDRAMRNGVWHRFAGRRLSEMTVGIIGVGRVGKRVIRHLTGGFPGSRVLANDTTPDFDFGTTQQIRWTDKEKIYREADIISLHLPLTPLTRQLIGAREIEMMRPGVLLINTSRGNMIVERDLADGLRRQHIGGAAIDVFEHEPYSGELATLDRCILTCHMGSMSQDCRYRMELEATEEALRFLRGETLQRLVPETEYELARG